MHGDFPGDRDDGLDVDDLIRILIDQQIIDIEAVVHVTRKITLHAAKMEKN